MSMTHEITTGVLRNKLPKRKGRGESSGHGKTSGRGTKGSKARNGKYIKRGYEGGQTPIFRRFPKRGFSNVNFTIRYNVINLGDLEIFDNGATIDQAALVEKGLIPDNKLGLKVLSQGDFSKKLPIKADKFSKTAFDLVGKAGGAAQNVKGEPYEFPKVKKKFTPREKVKKPAEAAAPAAP